MLQKKSEMSKRKVLIVTQEMEPYTALSELTQIVSKLPKYVSEKGMEIRLLMPRFGVINERRHRLHEVVRLSGMNIIVDDDDYPLIIKVASLPDARIQVYFLDNEDFFKRKAMFEDADGNVFDDNADRMIFFCKGVIEIVKKFGWPPDIIHCHGWMTGLIPFFIRNAYKTEPLFQESKIIYSAYKETIAEHFSDSFYEKASINNLTEKDLLVFKDGENVNLHKGAISASDAVIIGNENVADTVKQILGDSDTPLLEEVGENYLADYVGFYKDLLSSEEEGE